ncbi:histone-lysine N-methyltransferase SETDB1-B-like [Boleophthalmus pectinirostris]|uniref:histone-lysine N-methyltransferase SETDB1-B-like n=1 Tax=Boleophthalmus pectinirostris TaxID=150288 RepID=UPI000A1C5A72|nr:histone-lysine N-methyltransferase SETDB1-B-like [Boleophthalmus pectinirostris]
MEEEEKKAKRSRANFRGKKSAGRTSTGSSESSDSTRESPIRLTKEAVVVLTKLPQYKMNALRPPTPEQFYSEEESLSSSDSDMQWEPGRDSSDSELSLANKKTKEKIKKRVKITHASCSANNNLSEDPVIITSTQQLSQGNTENTKARPELPEPEIKVDMMVIARKKPLRWERGKVLEIVTKDDGRVKYKVSFEEKGKSLVSGHHVALDSPPKLAQLYVGARVVVRCQVNKFRFWPGILAELPSRSNRLRFLVFIDDHTPVYVGLPLLHLVCRQLDKPLEDVPESAHRIFMEQYLNDWPYPHLTQYRVGQNLNAELNGVQKRCEVLVVDGSLIQVVFHENQFKEWIHRGSTRLEHMARFLELKPC